MNNGEEPVVPKKDSSGLFEGIEIHINGYTKIDRVVLIKLIVSNGGTVCRMPRKKTTTYVLSDQDNLSKEGFRLIKSNWVLDCIEQNTLLPFDYDSGNVNCNHPNFVNDYYSKSRLHFISMEKLQLRAKYLKISKKNNDKTLKRLIYYIDFDSFFVSGSVIKYNRVNKYFPIDITRDCVIVSNGSRHSEITSINYVAKDIIGISRHNYFEKGREKYEKYMESNPYVDMKWFCLKVEFDEYRNILTQFYNFLMDKFDTVIPMSVDEGMFFEFIEEESIDYTAIMRKTKLIKTKVKEMTGVTISVSVTNDFLFLNKIILKRIKPDGTGICISETDFAEEVKKVKIVDVPMTGAFMINQLQSKLPPGVYKSDITVEELTSFIEDNYSGDFLHFFQPLINQASNSSVMKFIDNIFLLKDDDVSCKNKNGDIDFYTPKTVSCTINYHMNFTNLWDINKFVKRFSKYLVDRLMTLTKFYESIKKIGVTVVVALEGNVVSKFGGMGNNVKRLTKVLTYDSYLKIDSRRCLDKLSNDFYTLIKLLVNKDKLNDIKGISLQLLKLKNNSMPSPFLSPLNFNFTTPDDKVNSSPTKRISTHSKETLVKLIDNDNKETLSALPLDVLQDLYFQQRFNFKSKSTKRMIISSNSSSIKKIQTNRNSPGMIISGNVRDSPNKERLNVFEPLSFQAEKSISAIKKLIKSWITYSISTHIPPTEDDVNLFLNFLKNLKAKGQQSRLDNLVTFTNNHLQIYQYENDETGVINEWEKIMILKLLPLLN